MMRLQKYISDCGYTSRRKAEELILAKAVTVNGKVANLGDKVDEDTCVVRIHNKLIKPERKKVYIMLNKPNGYLSTVSDDRGRKTVVELVGDCEERIFPVGRLDYDTEGLLILTNDGDFTYKVTHPKHQISKTYIAKLDKNPTEEKIALLKDGVEIEDYTAVADQIEITEDKTVRITISQGKNRQVRKMFEKIGYKVVKLKRISIGELELVGLPRGKWRYLKKNELEKIYN